MEKLPKGLNIIHLSVTLSPGVADASLIVVPSWNKNVSSYVIESLSKMEERRETWVDIGVSSNKWFPESLARKSFMCARALRAVCEAA